jgi:hypothetical protein
MREEIRKATPWELAGERKTNFELAVDLASLLPEGDLLNADVQTKNWYHLTYASTLNEKLQNERRPNEMTVFRANVFPDVNLLMCSW